MVSIFSSADQVCEKQDKFWKSKASKFDFHHLSFYRKFFTLCRNFMMFTLWCFFLQLGFHKIGDLYSRFKQI